MATTKRKTSPPSAREVMQAVVRDLGREFAELIYMDRNWLWYCGESLQHQPEQREKLKNLGFRFAPKGHPMQIGTEVVTSHWGHSCEHPVRIFKKPAATTEPVATPTDADLVLAGL